MELEFYKYQGTGNDFVMIDNRSNIFPKENTQLVAHLCDRRFGIGADGLILLDNDAATDFRMVYYNSDGNLSSMCGNGGRCLVAFAKKLNVIQNETTFMATDGLHYATVGADGIVSLQMIDVAEIKNTPDYSFLNTGSPHHVQLVTDLEHYNVKENGAAIRYGDLYGQQGSNINFVKKIDDATFSLRTYERGVEDETYACGTGVTAVAMTMAKKKGLSGKIHSAIKVKGGDLSVDFKYDGNSFSEVFLEGPATFVFLGAINI